MQMKAKFGAAVMALACMGAFSGPVSLAPAQADVTSKAQGLPDVADLVDKLLPTVVEISVQSKGGEGATPGDQPDSNPFKDFFDEFLKRKHGDNGQDQPKDNQKDNQKDSQKDGDNKDNGDQDVKPPEGNLVNSMGSGFIIDPKGIIVTNNHVIADAVTIMVHLQDGTLLKAELVGHDPKTDIAVIRVKPDHDLPAAAFGDSEKVRIGQWAMAIGNPFGLGGSVSLGIISARGRDINQGPYDDYFQTDAAINKGNSGGPLFDMNGNVIGVNTAIFSPSGGSVGIGFSVPANEAKSVAEQLIQYGETRRGWLGVKLQTLTPDVAEGLGLDKNKGGALVADNAADGPADKAGIKPGDVITKFDGHDVGDNRALRRMVAETPVGKSVDVIVMRSGKEMTLKLELGRLEEGEKQMAAADQQPAKPATPAAPQQILGMAVSDLDADARSKFKTDDKVKGAIVSDVAGDSAAADKGITAGDVIEEVGGKPIATAQDVADAVDAASKVGKNTVMMLVAHAGNNEDKRLVALKLKK